MNSEILFSVPSNMIERCVVEAAVQECSQSVDETMYVDKMSFSPCWWYEVLILNYFLGERISGQHFYSGYFLVFLFNW